MELYIKVQNAKLKAGVADFDENRDPQALTKGTALNSAQSLSLAHLLVDLDKTAGLTQDLPAQEEPAHTSTLQHIDLQVTPIDLAATRLLNEAVARFFNALPIQRVDNVVTVAMLNPHDLGAQAQIMAKLQPYHCRFVAADKAPLQDAFARYYRKSHDLSDFVNKLESEHQAP
ncbi:MAG: hypothetical protein ACRC9T_04085, partial [Vibrionaceae bacterium]